MVRGVYIRLYGERFIYGFFFFFTFSDRLDGWGGREGVVLFRGHSPRPFHEEVNRRAAIIGLFLPLHSAYKQIVFSGCFLSSADIRAKI